MGIEQLVKKDISKHFNPLNKELDERTPKYCSWPIKALKFIGLAAIIPSIVSSVHIVDVSPRFIFDVYFDTLIKSGLVSVGIYLTGAAADYLALRRVDKRDTQTKELTLMEEYEELLQEQRDKLFEEMLERYPILKDPDFITHFPEIKEVALHIYSVTRDEKLADIQKRFPIFYSMELTNLEGYLNLLRQGNPKVIKDYEQLEKKLVNSEKQL